MEAFGIMGFIFGLGALEKLKSMDGEYEKLHYYGELMEIARKLEEFKKGKEDPN